MVKAVMLPVPELRECQSPLQLHSSVIAYYCICSCCRLLFCQQLPRSMALRSLCCRVGQQRSSVLQTFLESRRWQSSPTVFDKL